MAPAIIRPRLKTAFKKARAIRPLYTGGPVAVSQDGRRLVTCIGEEAVLSEVETGNEICRFAGDTSSITAFCLTVSGTQLLVFSASMSLRIYDVPASSTTLPKPLQPSRVVARAHDSPIHVCTSDPTSTYAASGSADGVVKVWDIHRGFVTHVFKGHGGVISALKFNYPRDPNSAVQLREQKFQLITACVDTKVRIFDLVAARETGRKGGPAKAEAILEGHHSVPRGLDVSADGRWLVSGGRDSVVLFWDLTGAPAGKTSVKGKDKATAPVLVKTVPVLERVEAVGLLSPNEQLAGSSTSMTLPRFFTGGEKGVVKVWDTHTSSVLCTLGEEREADSEDQEEQRQILDAIYIPFCSSIASVHADQNLQFHSLATLSLSRQVVGYNDEIVDGTFLSSRSTSRDSHIALATNSSLIRVYSVATQDARLLEGHSDIVLSLDHGLGGAILASGSKDKSARLWAPVSASESMDQWGWACVGVCEGHAESVGAIAMSRKAGADIGGDPGLRFMFTGSQDRTIKMWDLSKVPLIAEDRANPVRCSSLLTSKAHDKDINALDVAPNDRLLASGSQDKTAKVYEFEYLTTKSGLRGELKLLGTCKGHKRGVWTVRFSKAERVLATGSGDKTIRLWNLDDFSCVKTFEGHTNSVLRVDFLNAGMQMVSSASDGLVKLWNVRDEECVTTMDGHEDKVWALAVSSDELTVVSGASDSVVNFWQDCTQEQETEKETKRMDLVMKEQDLMNYLVLQDYQRAISLALAMEQPGRLFNLLTDVRNAALEDALVGTTSTVTGSAAVDEVIRTMPKSELTKLLGYLRDWNARAKTSVVAQDILHAVVKLRSAEDIMAAFQSTASFLDDAGFLSQKQIGSTALTEIVDALIPYTERHLSRVDKLVQESFVIDYLLSEMDTILGDFDETDVILDEVGPESSEEDSNGLMDVESA